MAKNMAQNIAISSYLSANYVRSICGILNSDNVADAWAGELGRLHTAAWYSAIFVWRKCMVIVRLHVMCFVICLISLKCFLCQCMTVCVSVYSCTPYRNLSTIYVGTACGLGGPLCSWADVEVCHAGTVLCWCQGCTAVQLGWCRGVSCWCCFSSGVKEVPLCTTFRPASQHITTVALAQSNDRPIQTAVLAPSAGAQTWWCTDPCCTDSSLPRSQLILHQASPRHPTHVPGQAWRSVLSPCIATHRIHRTGVQIGAEYNVNQNGTFGENNQIYNYQIRFTRFKSLVWTTRQLAL